MSKKVICVVAGLLLTGLGVYGGTKLFSKNEVTEGNDISENEESEETNVIEGDFREE